MLCSPKREQILKIARMGLRERGHRSARAVVPPVLLLTEAPSYLIVELVGVFPALDHLLYVSVDRLPIFPLALGVVDRAHYRLSGWSSAMDLLHSGRMMYRPAVRVMTGKIDQEVGRIPALHITVAVRKV